MAIFAFTNGYFLASSVVIGAAQANDEEKENFYWPLDKFLVVLVDNF